MASEQRSYVEELGEQRGRLASIELYGSCGADSVSCPVCGTLIAESATLGNAIVESIESLSHQLERFRLHPSYAQEWIAEQEGVVDELLGQLRDVRRQSAASKRIDEKRADARSESEIRAHVAGQIQQFLDDIDEDSEENQYEQELEALRARERALQKRVGEQQVEDRMAEGLKFVGQHLSRFAQAVKLNYSSEQVVFDVSRLSIRASGSDGDTWLHEMGGHATHVGYHIGLMLSLHELFADRSRPVPRFLVLDQPSIPYFSPDEGLNLDRDEDREALSLLLREIFAVVRKLAGKLQVIILEHADFDEPWFSDAVRERWRGDSALVPANWYSDG